jgi:gluconolactonase
VHCISPEGKFLGKILVPETVSNICFGGRAKHQLFITATTSLYAIKLNRSGIQKP